MKKLFLLGFLLSTISLFGQYTENSAGLNTPEMEGGPAEFEFVDINFDGFIDIVSVGDHGSPFINTDQHGIMIWFGNGSLGWTLAQTGNFGYGGIAAGDVNNDGFIDIGFGVHHNYSATDFGNQVLEVALGDITGVNWTPWDDGLGENGQDWGMFGTDFADVNNDGWLDIGSVSFGCCDGIHVHLNNHEGSWPQSFGFIGGNSNELFDFADVNRDGYADFIVSHQDGTVYLGDGTGDFTQIDANLPAAGILGRPGTSVGDVNNDGADDFACLGPGNGIEVWSWNVTQQQWTNLCGSLPQTGNYGATQLCDLNMDGNCDLALFSNGSLQTWLGDGGGGWTPYSLNTTPTPGYCKSFRAGGDPDRNGYPDMLVLSEEGSLWTYTNHIHLFTDNHPATDLVVKPVYPKGHEVFREGTAWIIRWMTEVPATMNPLVRIELSAGGPNGPWTILADNLPNTNRFQLPVPAVNSENCYLKFTVTDQSGSNTAVTTAPFTIIGTTVGKPQPVPQPAVEFTLSPNPSNGRLKISFSLGKTTMAGFELTDGAGRTVLSVPAADYPAGQHAVDLGHLIDRGVTPDNGFYFVRMNTSEGSWTAKLILLR